MQRAAAQQGEVEERMHGLTTAAAEANQALQQMQQEQSELAAAAWAAHLASQEAALQQERDKYLAEQVLLLLKLHNAIRAWQLALSSCMATSVCVTMCNEQVLLMLQPSTTIRSWQCHMTHL